MNGPVEKTFRIMRLINNSDRALNIKEIAAQTDMDVRAAQRHAMRLAKEGLIDFKNNRDGRGFKYMKQGLKV